MVQWMADQIWSSVESRVMLQPPMIYCPILVLENSIGTQHDRPCEQDHNLDHMGR